MTSQNHFHGAYLVTVARSQIVDAKSARYYHCISKTVRGADLMGDSFQHRKQWVEDRLEHLSQQYAISVASFAIMDDHVKLLLRLEPEMAKSWSGKQVLSRWLNLYPPAHVDVSKKAQVDSWINENVGSKKLVADLRRRLQELGWFMKSLKEPISRMANAEDQCRGVFWAGRYKSIAIVDVEARLATCCYIDLNPLAAGKAATAETSLHTSYRQRFENVKRNGSIKSLKAMARGEESSTRGSKDVEQNHWLVPIEDCSQKHKSKREGVIESISLGCYMLLLEYLAKLFRTGKARIHPCICEAMEELGISAEEFGDRVVKMLESDELRGNCFAANQKNLDRVKKNRNQRVTNMTLKFSDDQ
jgi:REP element-mobilizing transposase RayT